MKPDTRTVIDLFERDVRFVVPLYQRPYVWDEEHQWALLWEDIRVLLDHRISHDAVGAYSHFLGAIVVEQETPVPGEIPLFTVIDGQQRLTTLQIILAAAVNVSLKHGQADVAGLLRDLLLNDRRKAKGDRLFKVWPTNVNRSAFAAVISPEAAAPGQADDPANLIQEAFVYFVAVIDEWISGAGDSDATDARIHTLRVCLSDLLKLVSITLEPGDNAQVIFETLNARGTQLLALDLVKNSVFREATRQGLDVDTLHERDWEPQLDDKYWRKLRRQGRLNRAQGELFLMHWLSMKRRRVVPATELFVIFRSDFLPPGSPVPMGPLIQELCADAAIYRSFDHKAEGTVEGDFFHRLQTLEVSTALPLVLMLFKEPTVTPGIRARALSALESWLVRRTLLRLTTKDYNNQFAALMKLVADDPSSADTAILRHLVAADSVTNRWPTDREVTDFFDAHGVYGNISQPRLVMVFRALEKARYSDKVEALNVPVSLSIEHVMPQKWRRNWPLVVTNSLEQEELETQRDARIHKLGNLTATTIALNQEMSNADWATKQGQLNMSSKLLINTELLDRYGESFGDNSIDERTRELARRICRIWAGPQDAETWGAAAATAVRTEEYGDPDGADKEHAPEAGVSHERIPVEVLEFLRGRAPGSGGDLAVAFARAAVSRPSVELRVQKSKNQPTYFQVRSEQRRHVVAYVTPATTDVRIDYRLPRDHATYGKALIRADVAYGIQLLLRHESDIEVASQLLDDALAIDADRGGP